MINIDGYGSSQDNIKTLIKPHERLSSLSDDTKKIFFAVQAALIDANILQYDKKIPVGIIGLGNYGSITMDIKYYEDYIKYGKTNGRSNLFIQTLPTSSLAEAAIHFNFTGPLIYYSKKFIESPNFMHFIVDIFKAYEISGLLLGIIDKECLFYYLTLE